MDSEEHVQKGSYHSRFADAVSIVHYKRIVGRSQLHSEVFDWESKRARKMIVKVIGHGRQG